jgi:sugar fermentation stimulation protein A
LIEEALRAGVITELNGFTELRREVAYGQEKSRIDFRLEYPERAGLRGGEKRHAGLRWLIAVAAFPDAVTQRGAKHLRELAHLARDGIRAVQLYCVNLAGIRGGASRPGKSIRRVRRGLA